MYNNALLTAFKGRTFERDRLDSEAWGRWVESAVGAHLICQAEELGYRLYYWRERNNEVDFIVVSDRTTIAIEVKSGRRAINRGLPMFDKAFHPNLSFVVGTGGIPIEEFLTANLESIL